MQLTLLFAALFLASVLLNLLATVTARCRQRARDFDLRLAAFESAEPREPPPPTTPKEGEAGEAGEATPASLDVASVSLPEIPATETGGHYLRQVFSPAGILGALSTPIALIFLVLNAMILAETFELLLDRAGTPFTRLNVAGQSLELTDFHLLGLLCSVALLLIAGFWAESHRTRSPSRWFLLAGGLLILYAFEVGVSGYRGWHMALSADYEDPLVHALFAASMAHIAYIVELMTGIWLIHGVAIPSMLTGFWYLVAPFRFLKRKGRRKRLLREALSPPVPRPRESLPPPRPKPRLSVWVRAGARIDEGLIDVLRAVDRVTLHLLRLPAAWWRNRRTFSRRGVDHA